MYSGSALLLPAQVFQVVIHYFTCKDQALAV